MDCEVKNLTIIQYKKGNIKPNASRQTGLEVYRYWTYKI